MIEVPQSLVDKLKDAPNPTVAAAILISMPTNQEPVSMEDIIRHVTSQEIVVVADRKKGK